MAIENKEIPEVKKGEEYNSGGGIVAAMKRIAEKKDKNDKI